MTEDLEARLSDLTSGLENIGGPELDKAKVKWLYEKFLVAPRRKYEAKIGELNKFLKTHHDNGAAHYFLGECYKQKKDKKKADEEKTAAYALSDDSEQAVINLSTLLRHLRRPYDAYSICRRCYQYMQDDQGLRKEYKLAQKEMREPRKPISGGYTPPKAKRNNSRRPQNIFARIFDR